MRRLLGRLSLRGRLLLLTVVLLLAGLSLISAVVSNRLERYQVDRVDQELRSLTDLLAHVSQPAPETLERADDHPDLLAPGLDLLGNAYVTYADGDGSVVADIRSPSLDDETLPSLERLREIPATGPVRPSAYARPTAPGAGVPLPAPPRDRMAS